MNDLLYLTEKQYLDRLQKTKTQYKDFLKERNELNQFKHRRLRAALRSLTSNAPYLFTYKQHPNLTIPTTTNTCDGSFAHWKQKVRIHRGLRHHRKSKLISSLLQNS